MSLKHFLFRLLGKDPEAVVVSFLSGPQRLSERMLQKITELVPDREHYAVTLDEPFSLPGVRFLQPREIGPILRRKRIGLAPVLFTSDRKYDVLRLAAFRKAPHKILAYNERLERHHLRASHWLASALFVGGVPVDRIYLRPSWLAPWKKDRSVYSASFQEFDGKPLSAGRPRIAVLTPYFPYPLSHGGAVRMFNLLRQAARDFDIFLFSFAESSAPQEMEPVLEICSKVALVPMPRYREPRWSTLLPPEVKEFYSPAMARLIRERCKQYEIELLQVEYTQMASYGGDVLVEHDVTFDLYHQIYERERSRAAWWNYRRWLRFERRAVRSYRRVVVMSGKDAKLLVSPNVSVIPNGADLARFHPAPESQGQRLLFVGSFRHFPNIAAYRFFTEEIWQKIVERQPGVELTVVAGPDPELYWKAHAGPAEPYVDDRIERLSFVSDVRPLYMETNLVIVPTRVSAGTNLKVLEAMAMERAVISTTSGCAGLGLEHEKNIWIADTPEEFAEGVVTLLSRPELRSTIARAALEHARQHFDWKGLGALQRELWNGLLKKPAVAIRKGALPDLEQIEVIQKMASGASHWESSSYLAYDLTVAEVGDRIAGFMVSRFLGEDETEILNIAVDESFRRRGVATRLIESCPTAHVFLEVRRSNTAAQSLYRKLGFASAGVRQEYYEEPSEDAIIMRLSRFGNHANV